MNESTIVFTLSNMTQQAYASYSVQACDFSSSLGKVIWNMEDITWTVGYIYVFTVWVPIYVIFHCKTVTVD